MGGGVFMNIRNKLFKLEDKKYKDFNSNLCPGIDNIIGIRVPILRKFAREIFNCCDWKKVFFEIGDDYYEEVMLKGMLIGLAKDEEINIILQYVENYVPKINNWAICDTFCTGLKMTKKYRKEMWKFIEKYLNSEKEFEVRFMVVMILTYYIDEDYLKKDFSIFDRVKNDGYYAKMSVAWAISICLIKYFDETIIYLKNSKIDEWIYNKAIQKAIESYRISDNQKAFLRKFKK